MAVFFRSLGSTRTQWIQNELHDWTLFRGRATPTPEGDVLLDGESVMFCGGDPSFSLMRYRVHENQDTHTILAKHWLKFKKDLEDEDDEEIALGPHIYIPHLFIKESVYELTYRQVHCA